MSTTGTVPCEILFLKHADGFHGADRYVAERMALMKSSQKVSGPSGLAAGIFAQKRFYSVACDHYGSIGTKPFVLLPETLFTKSANHFHRPGGSLARFTVLVTASTRARPFARCWPDCLMGFQAPRIWSRFRLSSRFEEGAATKAELRGGP